MFSRSLQQLCYRAGLAFALVLVLGTSARAQYAGAYTGYAISLDGNNNPVLDAWTVEQGGMSGSGSCGSDQYSHDYYAYAQINGPNGTYSPYPTTNSTGGGASCPLSTRIDSLIPIQYLGTYTITQRGWAYCSFVGPSSPFADTGDMVNPVQMNNWADAFGFPNNGQVILISPDDFDTLVANNIIWAGAGVAVAIPVAGEIIIAVAIAVTVAVLTYEVARQISARGITIKNPLATGPCTLQVQDRVDPPAPPGRDTIGGGPVRCLYTCRGYGALVAMYCPDGSTCNPYVPDGWLTPSRDCQ